MRLAATDRQYKVGVEWKSDRLKLKRLEKTAVDEFEKGVGMLARVDGTADGALRAFGVFGCSGSIRARAGSMACATVWARG